MGKKLVLDTNVIISAFGWSGSCRNLLIRIIDGEFDLYISLKQLDEIKRVLDYPKFDFSRQQKNRFIELILEFANIVHTTIELDVVEDKDDNMLVECAVEVNADYVISGDHHLLDLKKYKKIKIVSVKDFLTTL